MNLIHIPLFESQRLNYTVGIDGYPAFLFTAKSDVRSPVAELFYPQFWSDFSLYCVVQPMRPPGGFIFAVVSPSGTHVQFGLRIADGGTNTKYNTRAFIDQLHPVQRGSS